MIWCRTNNSVLNKYLYCSESNDHLPKNNPLKLDYIIVTPTVKTFLRGCLTSPSKKSVWMLGYGINHMVLQRCGNNSAHVLVCTNLSGKVSHWQVDMDIMMTSGSPCGITLNTLVQNTRNVGLIIMLGTVFLISITHMTLAALTMVLYKLVSVIAFNLSLSTFV